MKEVKRRAAKGPYVVSDDDGELEDLTIRAVHDPAMMATTDPRPWAEQRRIAKMCRDAVKVKEKWSKIKVESTRSGTRLQRQDSENPWGIGTARPLAAGYGEPSPQAPATPVTPFNIPLPQAPRRPERPPPDDDDDESDDDDPGRGGGGPPFDADAARRRRRRQREEEEYHRAQLDYQTALLTYQINMSLHGGTGQRDAVSQLVAHQGRTEQQSKRRDREEFNRRMNAKKELPRIEAKSATSLVEELEKFDEFLIDARPKDSYETIEYLKASLRGDALEEWKWAKQTDEGVAMLAAAAQDDMTAYDDFWVMFVGNLCVRIGLDRKNNPMAEKIKREFEEWRLRDERLQTREDVMRLIGQLRSWY